MKKDPELIVEEIFRELKQSGFTGYDIELIKNMIEPPTRLVIKMT